MKDMSVVNDFCYYYFISSTKSERPEMTLSQFNQIIPQLVQIIDSKYEIYIKTGIKVLMKLLPEIKKVKYIVNIKEIDSDKIIKKSVLESLQQIINCEKITKIIAKQKNDDVNSNHIINTYLSN
jgi:hypothetical protein